MELELFFSTWWGKALGLLAIAVLFLLACHNLPVLPVADSPVGAAQTEQVNLPSQWQAVEQEARMPCYHAIEDMSFGGLALEGFKYYRIGALDEAVGSDPNSAKQVNLFASTQWRHPDGKYDYAKLVCRYDRIAHKVVDVSVDQSSD